MRRARRFVSHAAAETAEAGRRLGARLEGGEVVLLFGPLGAGKTVFVRGLAQGMGLCGDDVHSPSYTLIDEHVGDLTLYHVDLYRLDAGSLPDLGLEELPGGKRVVAVEWAELLERLGWHLGEEIVVEIDYRPGEDDARVIRVDKGEG